MKTQSVAAWILTAVWLLSACAPTPTPSPTTAPTRTPIATFPPTYTPEPTSTALPSSTPRMTSTPLPLTASVTPSDPLDNIHNYLDTLAERDQFSGAVWVSYGDDVLINQGYGLADRESGQVITPQTQFGIASVTQTFTALAVMVLQERQQIDIQQPMCIYLADCPEAWLSITTQDLLLHTSGITDYISLPNYQDFHQLNTSPRGLINRIVEFPLNFEPGTAWEPSNSNYAILGYLIETISGQSYGDFINSNILTPAGLIDTRANTLLGSNLATGYSINGTGWTPASLADPSVSFASTGMVSTVQDLYNWERMLFSPLFTTPETRDEIFTAHRLTAFGGVGYGWFINQFQGRPVYYHAGTADGYTAEIAHYPDDSLTIIVLANRQDLEVNVIVDRIARELFRTH